MKCKIIYDRERCIGAEACVAVCSKHWKMASDGKADLIGSKKRADGKYEKILEDVDCNQQAADSCPAGVIKIEKV